MQIGRETILAFQFSPQLKHLINFVSVELVCSYTGYFLLGYYLHQYSFSSRQQRHIYLLGILGAITAMVLDNLASLRQNLPVSAFYDSFSLPTFFVCVALFVFFKEKVSKIKLSPSASHIIRGFSANTFGVYLIHIFVLELLQHYNIDVMTTNIFISVPLLALLCFIISNILIFCLRHIPVIGKYIC